MCMVLESRLWNQAAARQQADNDRLSQRIAALTAKKAARGKQNKPYESDSDDDLLMETQPKVGLILFRDLQRSRSVLSMLQSTRHGRKLGMPSESNDLRHRACTSSKHIPQVLSSSGRGSDLVHEHTAGCYGRYSRRSPPRGGGFCRAMHLSGIVSGVEV